MVEYPMLADIQRTVYLSTAHHGTGKGKFSSQRPTFYPLCYATKCQSIGLKCNLKCTDRMECSPNVESQIKQICQNSKFVSRGFDLLGTRLADKISRMLLYESILCYQPPSLVFPFNRKADKWNALHNSCMDCTTLNEIKLALEPKT